MRRLPPVHPDYIARLDQRKRWLTRRVAAKSGMRPVPWETQYDRSERDSLVAILTFYRRWERQEARRAA